MKSLILAILGSLLLNSSAQGALMLYRFSGLASGRAADTLFTESAFSIEVLADTDNIISSLGGALVSEAISTAIDIVGVGRGTFTQAGRVFILNPSGVLGYTGAGADIVSLQNLAAFFPYNLKSELPTVPTSVHYVSIVPHSSSFGEITLTAVKDSAFTAISVPEPSTGVAAGLACAGMVMCRRRSMARRNGAKFDRGGI